METEGGEPPEDTASANDKGFIVMLVGFETMSIEMTSTHDNHLLLWGMGEEQGGHQVHKSPSTKVVAEGSSQRTHLPGTVPGQTGCSLVWWKVSLPTDSTYKVLWD